MDQFDRNSRQRLMEKVVEHRLSSAERDRDRARLLGFIDRDSGVSRRSRVVVLAITLLLLVVIVYLSSVQPADNGSALADEPARGTADDTTLVQPPGWWSSPQP